MINPSIPGKVTCKGRPNFLIIQRFEDWLFDCAREREAAEIAQDTSAVNVQLEADLVKEIS